MTNQLKSLLITSMMIIFLSACGAPSKSKPNTPMPVSTAPEPTAASSTTNISPGVGDWEGSGDSGFSISFTIGEGGSTIVGGYGISWNATCGGNTIELVEASTGDHPIEDGKIELTGGSVDLLGNVIAEDRIEGTFHIAAKNMPPLGDCIEVNGTWSAKPK